MREQLQRYYADKRLFRRIVVVILLLFIIIFLISGSKRWSDIGATQVLAFAGERMPRDWRYQLNIERLDREIALVQINPAQFTMIHKRRNLIIPIIEKQLKKAGLPDDLKYIPVIESALRENVSSSAGAAGLRQLMPSTAEHYGLIVNDSVDERYDIAKSTAAAISHLKGLGTQFDTRTLVAAAYNRGANGLQTSMKNQSADDFYDLRLNNETSRYVFRLLAMKYVREHKEDFFDRDILGDQYRPFVTRNISEKQIPDLVARAKAHDVSYYEVKKLNPRIMSNSLPEGKRNIELFTTK